MKKIDVQHIERLAASGCSKTSIAAEVGCSAWLIRYRQDLAEAFARGRARATHLHRRPARWRAVKIRADVHGAFVRLSREAGVPKTELIDAACRAHIAQLTEKK